jgi:hypothetical protein
MQQNVKTLSTSLLRKTITFVLLPIIVTVWMTGWTLMQIGSTGRPREIKQRTTHAPPEFEVREKSEPPRVEEDSRIPNKPIMA